MGVSEVLVILETPCFFVDGRKRCMEMIGIIIGGAAVVIAVSLYCCIRVGAEEDRRLEELDRRAKQDAEEAAAGIRPGNPHGAGHLRCVHFGSPDSKERQVSE